MPLPWPFLGIATVLHPGTRGFGKTLTRPALCGRRKARCHDAYALCVLPRPCMHT